jgi:hypothetical protein
MNTTILKRIVLHCGIAIFLGTTYAMTPAMAQQRSGDRAEFSKQRINRAEFPGRRIGGGTRGECLVNSKSLAALTPASNLGVTKSDRPVVYFSIPMLDAPLQAEFVLQDADGNLVYETSLTATKTEKIVGVHLPKNALKVGQDYQWYFSAFCDPQDSSQNVVLAGWLRHVSPEKSFAGQSNLELARAYQEAGLWIDAIATLVELRKTYPHNSDVMSQWTKLLQVLELDTVVGRSLVGQM